MATENILTEKAETVSIDGLKHYRKNPRIGDVKAIADSLQENGQFRPIIVQRSTGEVLGGNHTLKAARALGWKKISAVYIDVDDERAARIVLADNRTNDLASYDTQMLQDILSGLPNPHVGTGYDDEAIGTLLKGIQEQSAEAVESVLRPPVTTSPLLDDREWGEDDNSVSGRPILGDTEAGEVELSRVTDEEDIDTLDDQLGQLQGVLQLSEDMHFLGNNYYGIPDLARSGLLERLPDPIDTWGGADATPDDGVTTWVWNYGVASKKDLPLDRAILSFYTYDTYFESFWDQPAYMTAKMLNAGIKIAIVPDFSYYSDMSCATWVFNQYRAQWLGRYFQEAGIKVIPRIQYAIDKLDSASLDFNTLGIPKGAPVVAKCSHNSNSKEEFDLDVYGLRKSLEKVQPKQLLMYGGKPVERLLNDLDPVGKGLCEEVVHVYNYAHKRRGVVFDKKDGLAALNKDKRRQIKDAAASALAPKPPKKLEVAEEPKAEENEEATL